MPIMVTIEYGEFVYIHNIKFKVLNWCSTDPDAVVSLHVKITK